MSRWCPRSSNFLQGGNTRQVRKTAAGLRFSRASNAFSAPETERVNKDATDVFLVSSKRQKILRSWRSEVDNVPP